MIETITQLKSDAIIFGGLTLVCLALVSALVVLIKRIFNFMGNHIKHNTESLVVNTKCLDKLSENVKENTEFTREAVELIRELGKKNG